MPKAKIETKKYVTVPIVGSNGKETARLWLWEYLRDNDFVAINIEHFDTKIVAEIELCEEKEISKNP